MRGSDDCDPYCASFGAAAVSRGRSASIDRTFALAFNAVTSAASSPAGNVGAYIDSTGVASPGVPPAATISARWSASETPSANETMYGTAGPGGAAVVVVVAVVVAAVEVAAVVVALVVSVVVGVVSV